MVKRGARIFRKKRMWFLAKNHRFITPTKTGWWFGTFFICPYIGNNHPNGRTHIFQRGRAQPPVKVYKLCIKTVGFYPFLAFSFCRNSDPSRRGVAPGAPGARAGLRGSKGPPCLERGFTKMVGFKWVFGNMF